MHNWKKPNPTAGPSFQVKPELEYVTIWQILSKWVMHYNGGSTQVSTELTFEAFHIL